MIPYYHLVKALFPSYILISKEGLWHWDGILRFPSFFRQEDWPDEASPLVRTGLTNSGTPKKTFPQMGG